MFSFSSKPIKAYHSAWMKILVCQILTSTWLLKRSTDGVAESGAASEPNDRSSSNKTELVALLVAFAV